VIIPDPGSPIITVGRTRFLNVPHAKAVIDEVWNDDCYRLNDIPDGSTVIDVGAFYGEFSLICEKEKNCNVAAIEPNPDSWMIFRLNCVLNLSVTGVYSERLCIGGTDGVRTLFIKPGHPAGSSLIPYDGYVPNGTVKAITMENAVKESIKLFRDNAPICVKFDCEGAEEEIFNGDLAWLDKVSIVTMEWHNRDGYIYGNILSDLGFKVSLEGGGPKPRPPYDKNIAGGLLFATKL
jgi:FkbM family methyltransferase